MCTPDTAGGFSAAAFYFARKIYQENNAAIPIGLMVSSVGGTSIDLWLAPEGVIDIPALKPLLSQPVLPGGPFCLSNGMIAPLAPYGIKGAIWYQGENAERTVQSDDSYFLKMKALVQGWKRLWGMDDFPFYYVMIANCGDTLEDRDSGIQLRRLGCRHPLATGRRPWPCLMPGAPRQSTSVIIEGRSKLGWLPSRKQTGCRRAPGVVGAEERLWPCGSCDERTHLERCDTYQATPWFAHSITSAKD